MNHDLKIWPQFFERVLDGSKTFEIRKNDRGFNFGDTVTLREFNPEVREWREESPGGGHSWECQETIGYTDRKLVFKIGYVHQINERDVVFSLLPIKDTDLND